MAQTAFLCQEVTYSLPSAFLAYLCTQTKQPAPACGAGRCAAALSTNAAVLQSSSTSYWCMDRRLCCCRYPNATKGHWPGRRCRFKRTCCAALCLTRMYCSWMVTLTRAASGCSAGGASARRGAPGERERGAACAADSRRRERRSRNATARRGEAGAGGPRRGAALLEVAHRGAPLHAGAGESYTFPNQAMLPAGRTVGKASEVQPVEVLQAL